MGKRIWATVDDNGHLILPPEIARRLGFRPGEQVVLEEREHELLLRRAPHSLQRVYVEVTNRCNLHCRTCIRNDWEVTYGRMDEATFARILEGIQAFDPVPEVFFAGFGEPLVHPRIVDWVRQTKALGAPVALITNGVLLDETMARALIEAGLDNLWVSIDGATPEGFADVRLGEYLPLIVENLERFQRLKAEIRGTPSPWHRPRLGIATVVMRRNVHEFPQVLELGRRLGAVAYSVSNLIAYTDDMQPEVLYPYEMYAARGHDALDARPFLSFPVLDLDETTREAALAALQSGARLEFFGGQLDDLVDVCPFVRRGSTSIRWDGLLSPCWPLLYDHETFLGERRRFVRAYHVGNIHERSLADLWHAPDYAALRERLVAFDFAPCVTCNACELAGGNEEDCMGSPHPACGGCLWAQGFIQCP